MIDFLRISLSVFCGFGLLAAVIWVIESIYELKQTTEWTRKRYDDLCNEVARLVRKHGGPE